MSKVGDLIQFVSDKFNYSWTNGRLYSNSFHRTVKLETNQSLIIDQISSRS